MQIFARFVKNPTITTATAMRPTKHHLAVVDLYFDPEGRESVATVLVKEGVHLHSNQSSNSDEATTKVRREDSRTGCLDSEMPKLVSSVVQEAVGGATAVASPWQKMKTAYNSLMD